MSELENSRLLEVALRIRTMREICGFTEQEMAHKTDVSLAEYLAYESGREDFPFSFIHKCSLAFGVGITDLLEGRAAHLSSYSVTRKGNGQETVKEDGIEIRNLAPEFLKKIAEPYYVKYEYKPEQQDKPIHTTSHSGQEFDYILRGRLKVQIGDNIEYLSEGDSIFYNSSTQHGMMAVDGADCLFLALILPGEKQEEHLIRNTLLPSFKPQTEPLLVDKFISTKEDENGLLTAISFQNEDKFNFAFDVVDELGRSKPNKTAMIHISDDLTERTFTFRDMKRGSAQAANYFKAIGIQPGDRVMLVMRRSYQFWFAILGLHKIGAIAIPATNQLQAHDFLYRFRTAAVSYIICAEESVAEQVDAAAAEYEHSLTKILVGASRRDWRNYDEESSLFNVHFYRTAETPCGDDPMILFFTSGSTGYPKMALHSYKYALGHFITAKYWHGVGANSVHFTISDTGWGKALWGKLYGQWLCEGTVFTYDFDRFHASDILPMFAKYKITTFCAPPTMLRMMIKEGLEKYDFSSLVHITTAGEALNTEVYKRFYDATGLRISEGFGQTELTLAIGNLIGDVIKVGSMGKASPLYDIHILRADGTEADVGESGEIVVRTAERVPCGLFLGYFNDPESTARAWHDGYYHTGDLAWKDEDGFYWYVGRIDDVIKSSGYRIGPFEIENVIMQLPYVLECGVSSAPDPVRGQVVKASIVLDKGTLPSEELKKEIQRYVKENTAPYKYPRIVEFRDALPKTISGKVIRNQL